MRGKHRLLALWLVVPLILVGVGCGSKADNRSNDDLATTRIDQTQIDQPQQAEMSLTDQIALGRDGKASDLTLFESTASDSMLGDLNVDDAWLKTIRFDQGEITDQGIESLVALPAMRHLRLRLSPITDKGIETIAKCDSLQILNLPQCKATAKGVEKLAALPSLWNLRLGGDSLKSDTADAIAKITGLRSLHLIGVPIDDAGLKTIAALPELESLYLDDANVSEEGWDWLFSQHGDLHIHVNQKHLDHDPGKHD